MNMRVAVQKFLAELNSKSEPEALEMLESYSLTLYHLGVEKGQRKAFEEWVKANVGEYGPN